jgi:hypothetical protein
VTDQSGAKVRDEDRIRDIQSTLLARLAELESSGEVEVARASN